jgi:inosine/xanthosine triphosphatase
MKTILVASQNPVKAQAALGGFQRMFPEEDFVLRTLTVASGVAEQPFSSEETLQGAIQRAQAARQLEPSADYWVGIEGGVEVHGDELCSYSWVAIVSTDLIGRARSGMFYLPPAVAELVHQGMELGKADDLLFQQNNSKQKSGAIGILTRDVIDRAGLYEHAVILALVPFKNQDLYRITNRS